MANTGDAFLWARGILENGDLAAKLEPPPSMHDGDIPTGAVLLAPARTGALVISAHADKLPKPAHLHSKEARAVCLSRFAHHELQAVELFAWAILACPTMPAPLLTGMLAAAREEQTHLALYLSRLEAHDIAFGELPLSGYFWRHIDAIVGDDTDTHDHQRLLRFLCAQGLTLEQANLDFALMFRDGFAGGGDSESAAVCQRVFDDEIGHVALAQVWTARLNNSDDLTAYTQHVPFPLGLARAKGRAFQTEARRRAGMSDAFIAAVRDARPYKNTPAPQ